MNNKLSSWRRNSNMTPYHNLQQAMNHLFDDFWNPMDGAFFRDLDSRSNFIPSCDIEETKDNYLYTFDIPGMRKEDIKVEVLNNMLTISGERKSEQKDKNNSRYMERSYGQFQRSMSLPSTVNAEKVEATYEDGVLSIQIPKEETEKPRQITVGSGKKDFSTKSQVKSSDERPAHVPIN